MSGLLETAGERLVVDSSLPWVEDLIAEGAAGELHELDGADAPTRIHVEAERRPFATRGWELVNRGTWRKGTELIVQNACATGFDLHLRHEGDRAEFIYRWCPPARERAAALILRSRFHLLARAVLLQYPVLWRAGARGRAPLHASALTAGWSVPLVTAPSGIGRSTLVHAEVAAGGRATGDNLAVGDGKNLWGVVEPMRVSGAQGRAMAHGRNEAPMRGRIGELVPDALVVMRRGRSTDPVLRPCSPLDAARSLTTSTYAAGELRRYWAFAAMISAGSGVGPPHPPVHAVSTAFAARLPCFSLELGAEPVTRLAQLLAAMEVEACA